MTTVDNVNTVQTEVEKRVFIVSSTGIPVMFGHLHHRFCTKKTVCKVGAEMVQLYIYPNTDTYPHV